MAKFCIDPGHGGSDPGAVNGTRKEKDDVLRLAKKIKPLLEGQGHTVLLTRENSTKNITI
ncbi:MAG: N-acetylmuramoyl-L-alanine amidase, partial [Oscillospiraceae bacterium]|nr:N-acetylmuramoyl-L-alanine amidase [Oscillospiraceae bacterium]